MLRVFVHCSGSLKGGHRDDRVCNRSPVLLGDALHLAQDIEAISVHVKPAADPIRGSSFWPRTIE